MTMRRPFKHQFRVRLFRRLPVGGNQFGSWVSVSVRINRKRENALQRVLRDMNARAPDGWRYVID